MTEAETITTNVASTSSNVAAVSSSKSTANTSTAKTAFQEDRNGENEQQNDEVESLKAELARYKKASDKNAKEAAENKRLLNDYEKQLRAFKSAEQIAAEEQKAKEEAKDKLIDDLTKKVAHAEMVKTVISKLGTNEDTGSEIAEYLYGAADADAALTAFQKLLKAQEKSLRLEFGKVPAPGAGGANGEDAETQKAVELAKKIGRERAMSAKSLKDTLGGYIR